MNTSGENKVLEAIRGRRSIRRYQQRAVPDDLVRTVLEAGRWAPSGMNNQPWRFALIRDSGIRAKLAALTHYRGIVRKCDLCIAVFYHIDSGYDRDKDCMALGACVQNMLLAAHSQGLGAVWLGEILKRKREFNEVLGVDEGCELMAVIALGWPDEAPEGERSGLDSMIIKNL